MILAKITGGKKEPIRSQNISQNLALLLINSANLGKSLNHLGFCSYYL